MDDQPHLSQCMIVRIHLPEVLKQDHGWTAPSYTNIFSINKHVIIKVANTLQKILRIREEIIEKKK